MNGSGTQALRVDTLGVATVEYLVLMACVTLVGALAFLGLGVPLVQRYELMKTLLALPLP